jgi:class 3 adenylate cyclase
MLTEEALAMVDGGKGTEGIDLGKINSADSGESKPLQVFPSGPDGEPVTSRSRRSSGSGGAVGASIPVGPVPSIQHLIAGGGGVLPSGLVTVGGASNGPSHEHYKLLAKLQERESELARLKQEYLTELARKDQDREKILQKQEEYMKKDHLRNILLSVEGAAQERLLADDSFADLFAKDNCLSYVMSVDIRKSTDLMLKAVRPRDFAEFIRNLCDGLREIVLSNHGVFDKFTGDGILAFFPDFYSGDDAGFLAVKASAECHAVFAQTYADHMDCFTTARRDAGLGIGIDYGQVDLVTNFGGLTVVGPPVVYACRFGSAPAGTTLLNRQAYRWIFQQYSAYCTFVATTVHIKNEGDFAAYQVTLNGKEYHLKPPPWVISSEKKESQKEESDRAKK